jgi:hypothetical protein
MKFSPYLRAITGGVVFSAVLISGTISAHANTPTEPSTFGKCAFPSAFIMRKIVQQIVINDLKAKNLTAPLVNVTIVSKNVRSAVKQSNITGLTSVTANTDGSYRLNTSGPLSVGCASEATVKISGSYKDSTGARKTFAGAPQTVVVSGAFN